MRCVRQIFREKLLLFTTCCFVLFLLLAWKKGVLTGEHRKDHAHRPRYSSNKTDTMSRFQHASRFSSHGLTEATPQKKTDSPASHTRVKLIILTYMRSGSTLTGNIFSHHPNVFYAFEPLWAVHRYCNLENETAFFLDKDPLDCKKQTLEARRMFYMETMRNFLNCQFQSLSLRALLHTWTLSHSVTTYPFYMCTGSTPGVLGVYDCLPKIVKPCENAEVRLVKTIRFTMEQAAHLLKEDSEVKVIHLLRDPRSTLKSQAFLKQLKKEDMDGYSRSFCRQQLEDLNVSGQLKIQYPGRIMTVRYEDLATQPVLYAERLLKFVGLDMPQALKEHILDMTSRGKVGNNCNNEAMCLQKNDSSRVATAWRKDMDVGSVSVINKNCHDVHSRLGYLPLSTERELRNLSVPGFEASEAVAEIWTF